MLWPWRGGGCAAAARVARCFVGAVFARRLTCLRLAAAVCCLPVQGIDLIAGGRRTGHKNRKAPKSENVYIRLLTKVRAATCCVDVFGWLLA